MAGWCRVQLSIGIALNAPRHASLARVPFQFSISLPPPRSQRTIVARDMKGRIIILLQRESTMPIDDPNTWTQGAAAFKSIFESLRSAIGMLRDLRGSGEASRREGELIDAALDKATKAAAVAEAEVAKALGYQLCKCEFPPTPMLYGWQHRPGWSGSGLRMSQVQIQYGRRSIGCPGGNTCRVLRSAKRRS